MSRLQFISPQGIQWISDSIKQEIFVDLEIQEHSVSF